MSQEPPIVEVGAGDAGVVATWHSALPGTPIALIERSRRIGIRLMIRGAGKSSITHGGPMEELYVYVHPARILISEAGIFPLPSPMSLPQVSGLANPHSLSNITKDLIA